MALSNDDIETMLLALQSEIVFLVDHLIADEVIDEENLLFHLKEILGEDPKMVPKERLLLAQLQRHLNKARSGGY